jgi:5-methylcytosine-specific restriction protein A
MNFEKRYGKIGADFIEAHHLTPFAEIKGRPTKLDPKEDFAVVCPNCHRMLHKESPPLTIEDLRSRIQP